LEIRALQEADAEAFQAIRLEGLRESPAAFSSSYEEECNTQPGEIAQRLRPSSNGAVFAAFDGDQIVGIVGVARERPMKLQHKMSIWGMYVTASHRNRDIGRQLLEEAIEHGSKTEGVLRAYLGVNAENPAAIALYKAAGFQAFGLERGFLLIDGVLHDEIHMARVINSMEQKGAALGGADGVS
jgi:RimJ/RimL family protein N-acetyltransferase